MSTCNRGLLVAVTILYLSLATSPLASARSIPSPTVTSIHNHDLWKDSQKFTTFEVGKHYKGLSNVKMYFHEIGYNIANTPPSNFDDKYDENLVSSIKIYQKNYNLNPTGKLDQKTVQLLMTPRCGVPDVVKTSFDSDTNTVEAASQTYYYFGTKWPPTKELAYKYYAYRVIDSNFKNAVARAFKSWTNVTNINFRETVYSSDANITIGFITGPPFSNYDPQPWAYGKAPTSGEFRCNTNATWVSTGDIKKIPGDRVVHVESLSLHEIGHNMGLAHNPNDDLAVMYPYLNSRQVKANLTKYDIDAIQNLYNVTP